MGKDSRIGESLWQEWTGGGYEPTSTCTVVFFTDTHVDMEHELVRRALASALQRDGSVASLGLGYRAVEDAKPVQTYAGELDGTREMSICDENGETPYGELVDEFTPITLVEIQ